MWSNRERRLPGVFCLSLATNAVTPKGVARAVRLGSHQIHTACVWQRMCVCVRAAPLDTEDKDISELGAGRRREITDVRACVRYLETGRLCWSCEARPLG